MCIGCLIAISFQCSKFNLVIYISGFPKCSTTSFYGILARHSKVQKTYCTNDYPCPVSRSDNELTEIKEPNWWDNIQRSRGKTLRRYTGLFSKARHSIMESFRRGFAEAHCRMANCDVNQQVITGDFSVYTAWVAEGWQDETTNQGSFGPVVLTPQKIYKVLPSAKLIVLMRNPTDRLYSGYNFRVWANKNRSAEDFHHQCKKAIKWWHACTKSLGLSERRCAFGSYYPHILKDLDSFTENGSNRVPINSTVLQDQAQVIENYRIPVRIRLGLYVIYLKEWLTVFPRSSFLFLKYQNFTGNPVGTLEDQVYPFLDLPFVKQPSSPKSMIRSHYSPMLPETRTMLNEFYRPYNVELSQLLKDKDYLWNI